MEILAYYIIIGLCFWSMHWQKAKKEAQSRKELIEWGDDWLMCILFWPIVPVGYFFEWVEKLKKK